MLEYQDWVFTEETVTGFEIIDLVMDHPDCWYSYKDCYPALIGCINEE
jgi:hypothetical protein